MDSLVYSTARLVLVRFYLTANGQSGFPYGEWSVGFPSLPVVSQIFLTASGH